jgi:positive regulator of sigma E activity
MRNTGVVIERVGEMVEVQFERAESCKHCNACAGSQCRAMLHGDAREGDQVEVELPDAHIIRLSVLTYGVPLASLVIGLIFGSLLARPLRVPINAELFAALCGGALLLLGLRVLHSLDQRLSFRTEFQPRIVAVQAAGSSLGYAGCGTSPGVVRGCGADPRDNGEKEI